MGYRIALAALLLWAGAAGAMEPLHGVQPLPEVQPQGRYVDDDPSARYRPVPSGDRARFRRMVNAAIQKNPRNVTALSHRAYLFMEGGDMERARRDFDAAMAVSEPGGPDERNALWARGWASYDLGDFAGTFADWQRAIALHGGEPFWAAYSMALLYWSTGQAGLALQWYDTTATHQPEWATVEGMENRIKRWDATQQERMRALFAAWEQRPR